MNRALLITALLLASHEARADVLSLTVDAHGGGIGGAGMGGAAKDEAFFNDARGGTYGGSIGVEVLFVDVWVDHHQILAGDGLIGTWTQFMTGLDVELEMRDPPPQDFTDKEHKKAKKEEGKLKGYVDMGIGFGFGVGTGQQVMPPLDNSEISDKGFFIEGKLGAGFAVNKVLRLGLELPISGGYFFKNGFANDENNHYYGVEAALLFVVRAKIKIK